MSNRIRVLDETVINQIAAGEVIENPSSVVKELTENALDAGSTDILIEIQTGGRQLIRVSDNGSGMSKDDALLSLERHATSKLREIDDLEAMHTMGFRGEAVPSIASISKFTILTAQTDEKATLIRVEGGKIFECTDAVRDPGTTIEVCNLFYNVPVRKKFQKSPSYDRNEIVKMLTRIALANPEVGFSLNSDGKRVFSFPGQSREERIEELLGPEFIRSTREIPEGRIGLPSYTRNNRSGQYIFLNKRPIFCPAISRAVLAGYGTAMQSQRHPVFILYLELDGDVVDVNVHPQKKEVRLRNEFEIREKLIESVSKAFQNDSIQYEYEEKPLEVREEIISYPAMDEPLPWEEPVEEELELPIVERKRAPTVLSVISPYLLLEPKESVLTLIDQRRAHHRILFERMKKKSVPTQSLLLPIVLEYTPPEATQIREKLDELKRLGFSITPFGPSSFQIEAVPQGFPQENLESLLLEDFGNGDEQVLKLSSKAALSRKQALSRGEAQGLMDQLVTCENSEFCPYGKPIQVDISAKEIEEWKK